MIYSHNMKSNSAKQIAELMKFKLIKHENSKFKGSQDKLVINWGAKTLPKEVEKCKIINEPNAVKVASNKLLFFEAASKNPNLFIPEYTKDYEEAKKWCETGSVVVVRELLNSSEGKGIEVLQDMDNFNYYYHPNAKLYVKYIPKKQEYRVHVLHDEILDCRRKALKPELQELNQKFINWKIRNYHNGFIFVTTTIDEVPEQVYEQAVEAVKTVGLDFGAVDIIWNEFKKTAYVLEINTAPGLMGSSADNYKKGFEKLYKKHKEGKQIKPHNLGKVKFKYVGGGYVEALPPAPPPDPIQELEDAFAEEQGLEGGEF